MLPPHGTKARKRNQTEKKMSSTTTVTAPLCDFCVTSLCDFWHTCICQTTKCHFCSRPRSRTASDKARSPPTCLRKVEVSAPTACSFCDVTAPRFTSDLYFAPSPSPSSPLLVTASGEELSNQRKRPAFPPLCPGKMLLSSILHFI